MGSTGSGHFSDYSGATGEENGGQGSGGGSSGVDRCQQAFSVTLEEVAQCDYYTQYNAVPGLNSELGIILDGRVFAVDSNGTKVGAFPTSFNYLAKCITGGVTYVGVVTFSAVTPVPTVYADFTPEQT